MERLLIKKILKDVFTKPWNLIWIFVVPMAFMLFIGFTNGYENTLSGILFLPIITTCFMVVPKMINEYRHSSLCIEKLGNKVNSWKLTFYIPIVFFSILMIWITIMFLLFALIFLNYNQVGFIVRTNELSNGTSTIVRENSINDLFTKHKDPISYIENFFYFGYAAILGISWSFLVNIFSKKKSVILTINSLMLLYNIFFIGLIIPFNIIQTNLVLYGFSFLSPFKYLASMNYVSMWSTQDAFLNVTGSRVFDFQYDFMIRDRDAITNSFTIPSAIPLYSGIEKLMNFTIPFILISLCINFSSSHFRWFDKKIGIITKTYGNERVKYSRYSWYVYYSILFLLIAILVSGIALLIITNHTVTSMNVAEKLKLDINITQADIDKVIKANTSLSIYDPKFSESVNAARESRIAESIANSKYTATVLSSNLEAANLKYAIGMSFVTFMIIAISTWAGLFIKRTYVNVQTAIFKRYDNILLLN
ncbi:MAG: hypothetical protein RR697_02940 [Malacoplasma sp.]